MPMVNDVEVGQARWRRWRRRRARRHAVDLCLADPSPRNDGAGDQRRAEDGDPHGDVVAPLVVLPDDRFGRHQLAVLEELHRRDAAALILRRHRHLDDRAAG